MGPRKDREGTVTEVRIGVHAIIQGPDWGQARAPEFEERCILMDVHGMATDRLLVHQLPISKELDVLRLEDCSHDIQDPPIASALEQSR